MKVEGVIGVTARLLSEIGRPVDVPVAVDIEVSGQVDASGLEEVRRHAECSLRNWLEASDALMKGCYELR